MALTQKIKVHIIVLISALTRTYGLQVGAGANVQLSVASLSPWGTSVNQSSSTPKLAFYVINLNRRKDRCRCMQRQLVGAGVNGTVLRQAAVPKEHCQLPSDWKSMYGDRDHRAEQSLFCSNYKVWERASKSDAEFVVIMEDDVVLAPGFTKTVTDFIHSCPNFNYVTVDTFRTGHEAQDRVNVCGTNNQLFRPTTNQDYWSTHLQIIRKSYLPTMMATAQKHGMGTLDVWWMMRINDGTSFVWLPNIVNQARKVKSGSLKSLGCEHSVADSDIEVAKGPPSFFQLDCAVSSSA